MQNVPVFQASIVLMSVDLDGLVICRKPVMAIYPRIFLYGELLMGRRPWRCPYFWFKATSKRNVKTMNVKPRTGKRLLKIKVLGNSFLKHGIKTFEERTPTCKRKNKPQKEPNITFRIVWYKLYLWYVQRDFHSRIELHHPTDRCSVCCVLYFPFL